MHFCRSLTSAATLLAAVCAGLSPALADQPEGLLKDEHTLAAELALQADDYLRAVQEYHRAAMLSDDPEVAAQATQAAFDMGFNEQALACAQRWLELEPDSEKAGLFVALLELRAGDLKAARTGFQKFIDAGSVPPDQRLLSLLDAFSGEDPENVDNLVRMLAEPYGESALANYAVARTALQAGDQEQAMERASRAAEIDPEWLAPRLLYARAMFLDGDEEAAIDYTARIIGDDPTPDPDARMELAFMYLWAGRDDDALSQVNQVLLEQPSRSDALRLMAMINFQLGNFDAAWDDFEDVFASGRYTMDALYYLARIAKIRGETDQAIQLYSEVTGGDNALVSQGRASRMVAIDRDEPAAALEMLDDFADEHPQFAIDTVVLRAQLLGLLGRNDEALQEYDRAISFRPEDESFVLGRAELLLRMGRLDDAIGAYRGAVKRWPDSATSLNALGYTLADRTEDYREAEKLIRKALKSDPDNAAIIDSLGWVLFKRGKQEQALEQLENAYELFPDPEVAAHLVEVLVALSRESEALQVLAAAEARDPGHELLQQVRQRFFAAGPAN